MFSEYRFLSSLILLRKNKIIAIIKTAPCINIVTVRVLEIKYFSKKSSLNNSNAKKRKIVNYKSFFFYKMSEDSTLIVHNDTPY